MIRTIPGAAATFAALAVAAGAGACAPAVPAAELTFDDIDAADATTMPIVVVDRGVQIELSPGDP